MPLIIDYPAFKEHPVVCVNACLRILRADRKKLEPLYFSR
jgi:hypothetical protein